MLLFINTLYANPPENQQWEYINDTDSKDTGKVTEYIDISTVKVVGAQNPMIKCWLKKDFEKLHMTVLTKINIDVNSYNYQIVEEEFQHMGGKYTNDKIYEDSAWETPREESNMYNTIFDIVGWALINHKL